MKAWQQCEIKNVLEEKLGLFCSCESESNSVFVHPKRNIEGFFSNSVKTDWDYAVVEVCEQECEVDDTKKCGFTSSESNVGTQEGIQLLIISYNASYQLISKVKSYLETGLSFPIKPIEWPVKAYDTYLWIK